MGEEADEQRQDNEAGKGFLSFRALEEILQLVDLATISVHFSLCNQPICSSLHITSARRQTFPRHCFHPCPLWPFQAG